MPTPATETKAFDWGASAPEEQGCSSAALEAMREGLAERGTQGLLVIRNDRVVCEWYAPGRDQHKTHYTASLAKALVGGTSLLLALGDGLIGLDDRAAEYVPQWADDPLKSQITIRQLATHSSGLSDAEHVEDPSHPADGWMYWFWKRDPDPFTISRDGAPMLFAPGAGYEYSNPGMAMLAYCVTAALRRSPDAADRDLRALLAHRVYDPIGLREGEWSIGYGASYEVDGLSLVASWGGGGFTPRAAARVGRLMLRGGDWQGEQLLDPLWARTAVQPAGTPLPARDAGQVAPASGLCWYSNQDGIWPDVPRDAFTGGGAGHQILLVIPSLGVIAVRNGVRLAPEEEAAFWKAAYQHFLAPVANAVRA